MYSIQNVLDKCHQLAAPNLAESYDNVGLLIGSKKASVTDILCALDLNEEVLKEALELGVQCIITHHPYIFSGLKKIDFDTAQGSVLQKLIANKINLIAMHTNFDIANGGINDYLAEQLCLEHCKPLKVTSAIAYYKVCVYVPRTHADCVRQAIIDTNGTTLGHYKGCTFSTEGKGTFIPLEGSNPTIGTLHAFTEVEEVKLECMVIETSLQALLKHIKQVHPYEEVAIDVIKLENYSEVLGIGRVGRLQSSTSLETLINNVKSFFKIPYVRVVNPIDRPIERLAICSGSGSSFLNLAAQQAEVYITGDLTFHTAQEAKAQNLTVLDVGHYASENIAMPLLKNYLQHHFEDLTVHLSSVEGETFYYY